MRLLFALPSVRSPVGEQFVDLALHLHRLGHTVLLTAATDVEASKASLLEGNVAVVPWPREGRLLGPALFLSRLIRSWRPDCVVSQFGFVNFALPVGWLHRVPRRIAWFRTLVEQSAVDRGGRSIGWRLRLWRRRIVYRLATDVVSVSSAGAQDLTEVFGVPPAKCSVVPNGLVDPGIREPADCRQLVSIGRLVPSKSHDVLLDALAELRKSVSAELVLIGEGPLLGDLRLRARTLGLEDSVTFAGKIAHARVLDHLRRAVALIHPSQIDNCPAVVQEAMSLGVPIVATNVGGLSELVEDERTALLVRPDDPLELAEAVGRVLADPALRSRLTEAARRAFEERFERSRFVHRAAELLLRPLGCHVTRS